jgi:hypothetical protein
MKKKVIFLAHFKINTYLCIGNVMKRDAKKSVSLHAFCKAGSQTDIVSYHPNIEKKDRHDTKTRNC